MTLDDLEVGDRVTHPGNGPGTVTRISDRIARVKFDRETNGRHWVGAYDDVWFRVHPDLLRHLESVE